MTALAGRFEPTAGAAGLLTFEPRRGACAFLGYLTNLDEIVATCGLAERTSPAAAVYELVRREGSTGIARLRGAFVVALWDESHSTGLVATDHLGAGGLFYRSEGSGLVFGSEIRNVVELSTRGPSPERDAVIRWLANDAAGAGQTLYADVRRLGGGQLIEFADRSFRIRTYWRPTYVRPMVGTSQDYADTVRHAAGAAVRRTLASDGGTGILLSGGLDSSSIAAFAGGSEQSPVSAYSAVFPDHPEIDESPLIETVAASLGLPLTTVAVRGGSMLAGSLEYLARWQLPSASPNLLFMEPLAQAAADEGVSVLLDGEGGDELFSPSPYVFADLVLHGHLRSGLALTRRLAGGRERPRAQALRWLLRQWALKGIVPYAGHRAMRRLRPRHYAPPWLTSAAASLYGRHADRWEWKRLDGPRWWASLAFDFTEARQRMGAHDFLRHKSTTAGVQGRHPYFEDVELMQSILSIPTEASFDPTFDRPLLRHATAGVLPDAVRLRREKSYFNALFDETLTSTDRPALLQLFDDGAHVREYVQLDVIRGYVLGTKPRPPAWAWIVWRIAVAECWLRTLEDPDFPARAAELWQLAAPQLEFQRNSPVKAGAVPV